MSPSIKRSAIRALPWALAESAGLAALNLGSVAALARLLTPAHFGKAAVALSLVTFLQFVVTAPFSESLVQRQVLEEKHLTSAFTAMLVVGLIALLISVALASPIAVLYRDPDLRTLVLLGSLLYPLEALIGVPTCLLNRAMGLKSIAIRTLVARAISVAVSVLMAVSGFGAVSLIAGTVVGNAIGVAIIWKATDFRPKLELSSAHLRELAHFGAATLIEGVLWNLTSRAFVAVIGYIHGAQMLGYLNMGFRLVDSISMLLNGITQRFFLSLFSALQSQVSEVRAVFLQVSKASTAIASPIFLVIASFPSEILGGLFGLQWLPASGALRVLAVASIISYCFPAVPSLLKAMGKPYQTLLLAGTGAVFSLICAPMTGGFPIAFAALAWMSRQLVTVPLALWLTWKTAAIGPTSYLTKILPATVPAILLVVVLKACWYLLSDQALAIRLVVSGFGGIAVFGSALYLMDGKAILNTYMRTKGIAKR